MTSTPITVPGQPQSNPEIEAFVQNLIQEWKADSQSAGSSWWKVWSTAGRNLEKISQFLLDATDGLIQIAGQMEASGPDKKATVLAALAAIYDAISVTELPVWLSPWSGTIKALVIYGMGSALIDFIVNKANGNTSQGTTTK